MGVDLSLRLVPDGLWDLVAPLLPSFTPRRRPGPGPGRLGRARRRWPDPHQQIANLTVRVFEFRRCGGVRALGGWWRSVCL